jgi:hypothetical protein
MHEKGMRGGSCRKYMFIMVRIDDQAIPTTVQEPAVRHEPSFRQTACLALGLHSL